MGEKCPVGFSLLMNSEKVTSITVGGTVLLRFTIFGRNRYAIGSKRQTIINTSVSMVKERQQSETSRDRASWTSDSRSSCGI
jgi:hypothetical protein